MTSGGLSLPPIFSSYDYHCPFSFVYTADPVCFGDRQLSSDRRIATLTDQKSICAIDTDKGHPNSPTSPAFTPWHNVGTVIDSIGNVSG